MQKTITRKLWRWLQIIAVVYIVCGIALYFLQDKFLFHPSTLSAEHAFKFNQPFEEIYLPVDGEKNLSIVRFTVPDTVCKGVVLYFHGNRKNIERYAPYASSFTRNNYEVWMMDYPGFGKSTGERTEDILYKDALMLYKMARARFSGDSIILYGKSLGSGVAAQLASVRECKRLMLETPYYSIDALASHYAFMYPVSLMLHYHFPTNEYFSQLKTPVTLLHGTDDEVVPFSQSEHLLKIAPQGSELIAIDKGKHNDLADHKTFQEKIDSVLKL